MSDPVHKRLVFYVSGFDPRGAQHYHDLFKREAARHQQLSGWHYEVGPRLRDSRIQHRWSISTRIPDYGETHTQYCFLGWDDLIRKHYWDTRLLSLSRSAFGALWRGFRSGVWLRVCKTSWPAAIACLYPCLLVVICWLLMAVSAVGIMQLGLWTAHLLPTESDTLLIQALPYLIGLALSAVTIWLGWLSSLAMIKKLNAHWLISNIACYQREADGQTDELDDRIAAWSESVARTVENTSADEILFIGHSAGCAKLVSLLSILTERVDLAGFGSDSGSGSEVSALTLGNGTPYLGLYTEAQRWRQSLTNLLNSGVNWIDVTAVVDYICFPMTPPSLILNQFADSDPESADPGSELDPKLVSARFHTMFDTERYQAFKRDFFSVHFQYLMAADKETLYDYYKICCGERTLAQRFDGQPSVTGFDRFRL